MRQWLLNDDDNNFDDRPKCYLDLFFIAYIGSPLGIRIDATNFMNKAFWQFATIIFITHHIYVGGVPTVQDKYLSDIS